MVSEAFDARCRLGSAEREYLERHECRPLSAQVVHEITTDLITRVGNPLSTVRHEEDLRALDGVGGEHDDLAGNGVLLPVPGLEHDFANVPGGIRSQLRDHRPLN